MIATVHTKLIHKSLPQAYCAVIEQTDMHRNFRHLQALFSGQDMTVRKTKPFFYFDLFRTISDQDERSSAVI